ncbi:MAG: hypothetical protein RLY45_108 [Actinomycetota bacterium]|jgi:hypothetical protein
MIRDMQMTHVPRRRVLAPLLAALALVGLVAVPAEARQQTEHERIVAFWTHERVAKAVPRDFVLDPASGRISPARRPGGGGGGAVTGASWTKGGEVLTASGKVLFSLGSSYYVCSAAVVDDNKNDRSIILTAAHCVFDPSTGFASNWIFIPEYDTAPVRLSGSFCASTVHGCWSASSIIVSDQFASEPGFTTTAVQHDYAFVVVGAGGKSNSQLDGVVGSFPISFSGVSASTDAYLFGYPAAGKYKGTDLVYSRGPIGFDTYTSNTTYRVTSNMTGGSSGGPWFSSFNESTGTGTLMSVNSYGYTGITAMFGPILNSETSGMFSEALTASGNVRF